MASGGEVGPLAPGPHATDMTAIAITVRPGLPSTAYHTSVDSWRSVAMLTAVLATGCGSDTPDTKPSPTPVALHDTLVPADSSIRNGTIAGARDSDYFAPFDDFTPSANATIRTVEWQGYYCNTAFTGNAIPEPVATSFIIRLAPNEAGAERPSFDAFRAITTMGTAQVTTIAASAVRQQLEFTRMDAACAVRNEGDPAAWYRFSANLPSPYPVTAGGRYWLAIYAVIPSGPAVAWHWRFGMQHNSYSVYWSRGNLALSFGDRAFALRDR